MAPTRAKAVRRYTRLLQAANKRGPDHLRGVKRRLAQTDLFFLLVYVLNRRDVNRDWLYDRCREVRENPNGFLDLWSREHYKSTILTFGLTVQDILNDPEVTVGIFSHTRPIARAFLAQIKREFEDNAELKALFPDILWAEPKREAPKWGEEVGLIVRRRGNPRECTVEAWGLVDGQPTSKHFRRLVYDDVVTLESVSTPEMIAKVTNAWSLSLNLGTEGGVRRMIGTRYHFNDTYREVIARGAAVPRIHPATEDGRIDGPPVLLSPAALAAKRRDMGPYVFACQMMQDPKADETQGFREDWLRFWPARHTANLNIYILCDPASKKRRTSDYTSFFVVGYGADLRLRVVTIIRGRLNLIERANTLFHLHRTYRPLAVGYEEYGLQADIEHFQDRMERENYRFDITPLGGRLAKEDRIRRLIPWFEQGRVLLPETCWRRNAEGRQEDLVRVFIDDEFKAFPVPVHDDMLDALSRILDDAVALVAPKDTAQAAPDLETHYDVQSF